MAPTHFVLDQNFPIAVAGVDWPPTFRLTRLATIEPTLVRDHEDWEILYALDRQGDVDGFITNDANMLELPREMVMLQRTRLVLVVTAGVGHNPLRATGLNMVHLQEIARRINERPRIYLLRPRSLSPLAPGAQINKLAARENLPPNQLISREVTAVRERLG